MTKVDVIGISHSGTDRMGHFANSEKAEAEYGAPYSTEIYSHNVPGLGIRTDVESAGILPPKYSLILPETLPEGVVISISANEVGARVISINSDQFSEQAVLPIFTQPNTS